MLLVAVMTARLLLAPGAGLLASCTMATMSFTAASSSGGNCGDKERVFFHSLLHGGHHVGLLAVHGPQLFGLGDEQPHILVFFFPQQDVQLCRQLAQEQVGEEQTGLLAAGTELQHGSEKLRRQPSSQITHLQQLVNIPIDGELVGI